MRDPALSVRGPARPTRGLGSSRTQRRRRGFSPIYRARRCLSELKWALDLECNAMILDSICTTMLRNIASQSTHRARISRSSSARPRSTLVVRVLLIQGNLMRSLTAIELSNVAAGWMNNGVYLTNPSGKTSWCGGTGKNFACNFARPSFGTVGGTLFNNRVVYGGPRRMNP